MAGGATRANQVTERKPGRPASEKVGTPGSAGVRSLVVLSGGFADAHGLELIYRKEFESPRFPEMRTRKPVLAALLDAAATVMNFVLPGKRDVRHGDYHVILRKR